MEFDDLRTDVDLECPHCNRHFQRDEEQQGERDVPECPSCGQPVKTKTGNPAKPKKG